MFVHIDDPEPVYVEQLTLAEAQVVLARAQAELPKAFNSAHAAHLRMEIAEVEDQIAWLTTQARAAAADDAAVEHGIGVWSDHDLGVPA